jgi:hypothetical protein
MVGPEELRRLALALPGTTVEDHHGMDSYRVAGKIFATVPDRGHVRVMAGESEIRAAVADDSTSFEPFWWGRRLACVVVDLGRVGADELTPLLAEAWLRKAPVGLVREFRAQSSGEGGTRGTDGSAPSVGPA